jgi:hypothetical protein
MEIQSGAINYDQAILGVVQESGIPIIVFDNREYGSMQKEKWKPIDTDPYIYFVRNMDREEEYPDNVYPFDWPYFQDCDFTQVSKDELFSRYYDVCFLGTESPSRKRVIDAIIKDRRLKLYWKFVDYSKRQPYNEWLNEHRKAKLYLSCEGGGFTNERPNQLFPIAPMLKLNSNHLPANHFTDGINCIEIEENPSEEDIEKVVDIINDKDWLYDIYMNGINFTKEKLNQEAVANYVLKTINEHSDF